MSRKKFIATVMSVLLALSNVGVYGAEFSDFSSGEGQQGYQNQIYETEAQTEDQQEIQSEAGDSDTAAFQDETETPSDLTEFTDETPEISDGSGIAEQSEVAAASLADGDNIDENKFVYEYLPESDTYCLVKGADIENVVIPYQYNGKVVSRIGKKAFYGFTHIKKVSAEYCSDRGKNVIHVAQSAFEKCENLRKVEFLQGAKLESRAFYNCPKLCEYADVTDPDVCDGNFGATEIEEDSFDPDTKMIFKADEAWVTKTVQDFMDKYRVFIEITDADATYVTREDDGAFYYRDRREKLFCVDCDDTVPVVQICDADVIGRKAFYGCINVKKILVSQKTAEIENKAFAKCKNMSIIMPASVTSISEDAFEGASGITIYADKGSYAEKYAKKHGLNCKRTPAATAVPVPKLKITYTSQYGDAMLNWTPVEYANQYYLYKYNEVTKKYKRIAWINQNTTSYKIEGPVGKTDKYRVCAMSTASVYTSEYSKKSNTVEVQGRPGFVWKWKVSKKKGKNLTFKWYKAKGAQGYVLYRYDEKTQKYKKIKTIKGGNVITYTDKTGKLDEKGSYFVRAYCITKDGTVLYGESM